MSGRGPNEHGGVVVQEEVVGPAERRRPRGGAESQWTRIKRTSASLVPAGTRLAAAACSPLRSSSWDWAPSPGHSWWPPPLASPLPARPLARCSSLAPSPRSGRRPAPAMAPSMTMPPRSWRRRHCRRRAVREPRVLISDRF